MATYESDKEVMEFIQTLSYKKTKEKYKVIKEFYKYLFPKTGNQPRLSKESLSLLLEGDVAQNLVGLLDMSGKKSYSKKLKRSSIEALRVMHGLMFNHVDSKIFKVFFKSLDPESYLLMNLGKHFLAKYNTKTENISFDIIKFIKKIRPNLELEQFVAKEESYAKLDKLLSEMEVKEIENPSEEISQAVEEIVDDVQVVDDIEEDVLLKEPTTWDEVDLDNDELYQFLKEDNTDIVEDYIDDINFSQNIIPEEMLGKSMLDAYKKKVFNMSYKEVFEQATQIVEKSVKTFLNQKFVGKNTDFDSETVRPFIKTKNVIEQIYKLLFQMRGHDTIDSIAKQATDDVRDRLTNIKEKINLEKETRRKYLRYEEKEISYLDLNIEDEGGNNEKTLENVTRVTKQIKSKVSVRLT